MVDADVEVTIGNLEFEERTLESTYHRYIPNSICYHAVSIDVSLN